MYADVERFSFDETKHFYRVLQQQGRVALAADGNEQAAIVLHLVQRLAADVIGPAGGPGFKVVSTGKGLGVSTGHYWVDGLLVENGPNPVEAGELVLSTDLKAQPDYPSSVAWTAGAGVILYLDVWERHIGAAEDDSIRDPALGGPDTCTRTKLVWQVKAMSGLKFKDPAKDAAAQWHNLSRDLYPRLRGKLAVQVDRPAGPLDPCQAPGSFGYYGNENQLYRVEIHRGGRLDAEDSEGRPVPPTWKWSRNNGSDVYPLASITGTTAVLAGAPLDCRKQLAVDDIVEVVDDWSVLLGQPGPLARVMDVRDDEDDVTVLLSAGPTGAITAERHPLLRRWDGTGEFGDDGAVLGIEVKESAADAADWTELEDGIYARFDQPAAGGANTYRTGDYWTFAARAATGEVLWPADGTTPRPLPPQGVDHHLAPLAAFSAGAAGSVPEDKDLHDMRSGIVPIAKPVA
jgi:hypothetical protein